jgi:hypothetical protein
MSTPVRGADGPLGYAPRWARASGSERADTALDSRARSATPVQELPQDLKPPRIVTSPRDAASTRDIASSTRDIASGRDHLSSGRETAPAPDAPFGLDAEPAAEPASHWDTKPSRAPATVQAQASAPDTHWKRKKRSVVFEGDAALRELRSRLASAPDQTPEPPLYQAKTPIFAAVARLVGVVVLAAAGALGFLWITSPHGAPTQVASKGGSGDVSLVTYRGLEAQPKPQSAAENAAAQRAPDALPSGSPWAVANYNNVTDGVVGTPPATLAPRPPGPPRAPASRVTTPPPAAPAAIAPTPPPAALPPMPAAVAPAPPPVAPTPVALPPAAASVPAPKTPASVITTPVVSAPPPAAMSTTAASDRDEVAALLARARTYLSAGDVAAARLVLRRAAELDDAQAALALGGTYDPTVLKRLGIVNFQADPALAREWYRRAGQLGSPDASLRIEQLVRTDH